MPARDTRSGSLAGRILDRFQDPDEKDAPRAFVAALGVVAAVLVGVSVLSAAASGYTAIGVSFLAALALFVATVLVFETGRRLGTED